MDGRPSIPPIHRVRRAGRSGLGMPPITMALGTGPSHIALSVASLVNQAIDCGISAFDITASSHNAAKTMDEIGAGLNPWKPQREQLFLTARLGLGTQPGHLPTFSSRRHLHAGINALLRRTGVEYLDVLFMHRHDGATPIEESAQALADIVRQGKALYVGLSSFPISGLQQMQDLLRHMGTPVVAHQVAYSMTDRWAESGLMRRVADQGAGLVACAPLAHGLLVDAALSLPPRRGTSSTSSLSPLIALAQSRGQSVQELAVSWALRDPRVSSVLTSSVDASHLPSLVEATYRTEFTAVHLRAIDRCCPPPLHEIVTAANGMHA